MILFLIHIWAFPLPWAVGELAGGVVLYNSVRILTLKCCHEKKVASLTPWQWKLLYLCLPICNMEDEDILYTLMVNKQSHECVLYTDVLATSRKLA